MRIAGMTRVLALVMVLAPVVSIMRDSPRRDHVATAGRPTAPDWDVGAAVFWTARAGALGGAVPPGQPFFVRRLNTYLSMAQFHAAESAATLPNAPISSAIGAASAGVLAAWFPGRAAELRALLDSQLVARPWASASDEDTAAGRRIGADIAARVMRFAEGDRFSAADPALDKPTTAGTWTSGGRPMAREMYRGRAFSLTSFEDLRPPPPPAIGSPEFVTALREVRQISDTRTPAQDSIARVWNAGQSPRSDAAYSVPTLALMRQARMTDRQSAALLYRLSIAAHDALIACFNAKYTYWYPRPSQVDSAITLPIGLPPHPSYPSAHSCASGAVSGVLRTTFPADSARISRLAYDASLSRIYAGIHYRFDMVAGLALGRAVAERVQSADLTRIAILPP